MSDTELEDVWLPGAPVVGGRWVLYDGELPIGAWNASCAITGKPPERGVRFVDIGFTVENDTANGDVCLCEEYVAELGAAIGMVPGAEHEAALAALHEAQERLAFLELEADVERPVVEGEVLAALGRIESELARRKGGRPTSKGKPDGKQEG